MTELPLFSLDEPDRAGARNGMRWSTHKGRMRCDDCRSDQASGRLVTVARAARWRLQSENDDRYLCYEHARVGGA